MFIEIHILQNFAPANLNRDDTGAPKDCEFGGVRRARISSQCLKRTARTYAERFGGLPADRAAKRSRLMLKALTDALTERGYPTDDAEVVARTALGAIGISADTKGISQYLIFFGERELNNLVDRCIEHWQVLGGAGGANADKTQKGKKEAKAAVPVAVKRALDDVLQMDRAAGVAMYGRMLADLPSGRVDAASQVSHAISTHQVVMDIDYFTAVDDLLDADETGAGHINTLDFNSACYYRYSNIDLDTLNKNLNGHHMLAEQVTRAFLEATVLSIPTGKQNTMAAQNPPAYVMTIVREAGQWSLANAFEKPVVSSADASLTERSIREIDRYFGQLQLAYGQYGQIDTVCVWTLHRPFVQTQAAFVVNSVPELVQKTMAASFRQGGGLT